MMKLLEFLFTGCFHNWETIKEKEMVRTNTETYLSGNSISNKQEYTLYTLRCKNCGKIKSVKVGLGND